MILPFLDESGEIHLRAQCLTAETTDLLEREAGRLQQRIDCLTRNRDAIRAYLTAIQPGQPHLVSPDFGADATVRSEDRTS